MMGAMVRTLDLQAVRDLRLVVDHLLKVRIKGVDGLLKALVGNLQVQV